MMTIAWMTWAEILRKRALLVTVLMTIAFLAVFTISVHAMASGLMGHGGGLPVDLLNNYMHGILCLALGLYVANFTVAYLSIFSAAGTISTEIENGLLLAILPRPLARWRIYAGKWFGYTIWSLLYSAVMFWAVALIVHLFIHFPMDTPVLLKAFAVFELIPIVLVSLSILGSIYLPTLGNGVAMTLLFGLGLIGGFIDRLNISPSAQPALDKIALVTSLIIPTNAVYYRMVAELIGTNVLPVAGSSLNSQLGPFGGGPTPSNAFLVYTALYTCVIVAFGMRKFTKKDI